MIFHIAKEKDWLRALDIGSYKPPSLKSEGFIHCSTREQLFATAGRHFADVQERLVVLYIVDKRVKHMLKYEPAESGELFPHLYGKLPLEAVETTKFLQRNADGNYELI